VGFIRNPYFLKAEITEIKNSELNKRTFYFHNLTKILSVRGPAPSNVVEKLIMTLLTNMSEQAR
jgi:hypothetical protein